jgi:hypothetical protein
LCISPPPPPPREPLYREADFCLFVDPKMPFIDFTGRLFNFVFLSPTPCENFARKKKLGNLKKKRKRFLACLRGNVIIIIIIIIIIILLVSHDFVVVTSFN